MATRRIEKKSTNFTSTKDKGTVRFNEPAATFKKPSASSDKMIRFDAGMAKIGIKDRTTFKK